eukprot:Amastigsp_a12673_15.p3 type:complete len:103 gc:universal Amastigsp_a12673_15:123-431(+)
MGSKTTRVCCTAPSFTIPITNLPTSDDGRTKNVPSAEPLSACSVDDLSRRLSWYHANRERSGIGPPNSTYEVLVLPPHMVSTPAPVPTAKGIAYPGLESGIA